MATLGQLGIVFCLIVAVGIFASRCAEDERLLKRFAAIAVSFIILALALAMVRGELFRYAPGAQDLEADSDASASSFR